MQDAADRVSVDMARFPDLVMIMLGLRVRGWRSLSALRRIGPGMQRILADPPDGLLAHEPLRYGLLHFGFRQFWRDLDAMERFTRGAVHGEWWRDMRRLSANTGFWHETYHSRGGVEALYVGMAAPVGLQRFAPARAPVGVLQEARGRIQGGPPAG